MFKKLKEECGIFGIYSNEAKENLTGHVCIGLSALQHRGEESCGIAVNEDGIIHYHKDVGLVSEVFTKHVQDTLPEGKMAIGHVRYSTTGFSRKENAQPMVVRHKKGNLAVVHNGNLTNAVELKRELEDQGAIFTTTSDTEIICHIIVRERLKTSSIEDAIKNTEQTTESWYICKVKSKKKAGKLLSGPFSTKEQAILVWIYKDLPENKKYCIEESSVIFGNSSPLSG